MTPRGPPLTGSKDSLGASLWQWEGFPRQSARCELWQADVHRKMGKGTNINQNETTRTFTWEEVHKHTSKEDRWIVVDGNVYDITRFQKRHPGGAKIIGHFAGQDATVSDFQLDIFLGRSGWQSPNISLEMSLSCLSTGIIIKSLPYRCIELILLFEIELYKFWFYVVWLPCSLIALHQHDQWMFTILAMVHWFSSLSLTLQCIFIWY